MAQHGDEGEDGRVHAYVSDLVGQVAQLDLQGGVVLLLH